MGSDWGRGEGPKRVCVVGSDQMLEEGRVWVRGRWGREWLVVEEGIGGGGSGGEVTWKARGPPRAGVEASK